MAGRVGLAASKTVTSRRIAVIRALWFTECTLAEIGERLGISGKTVSLLAKRAGLPPRAKRPRPLAQASEVKLAVKLVLSRTTAERLTARAIREARKLEALIQEILEGAAK